MSKDDSNYINLKKFEILKIKIINKSNYKFKILLRWSFYLFKSSNKTC